MRQKTKRFLLIFTALTAFLLAGIILSGSAAAENQKREPLTLQTAQAIIDRINKEYGTEMGFMTDEDWELYVAYYNASDAAERGFPMHDRWPFLKMSAEEFEAQLRYDAEVTIPEMNRKSEEAIARMPKHGDPYYESYEVTPETIAAKIMPLK